MLSYKECCFPKSKAKPNVLVCKEKKKKFPDAQGCTRTQPPRAPGTSKSRLLYLSDTSTPGATEMRKEGEWVEMALEKEAEHQE